MTPYQRLGAANFALLAIAFLLSLFIMRGKHRRRSVLYVSSAVLVLMLCLTVFSIVIYSEYHA